MRSRWIGSALVVDAPAKLNLSLSVLGRRPDGYHELETVMVSVGLYDTLVIEPHDDRLELTCEGESGTLPGDDSNLVMRAAALLKSTAGVKHGAVMRLIKRIPMQAGMGGGSSDAAAALVGLNAFWDLRLSSSELHPLAAQLGSDINFFLDSPPLAICRGRGEVVEPQPLACPLWFVIAKPDRGLSTAAVFRQLDLADCGRADSRAIVDAAAQGHPGLIANLLSNDLQRPSRELSPEISDLLDRLQAMSLFRAQMTGSGSACFGVAAHREQATRAARRLKQQGVKDVFVARTAV
ncbi:4-diphosphocytidyl-2-C-methyl-D-erythritol kinase [Caulifigura coniformis]|uniref:4-diphosphocytidyl-2-C-methyl-D-erythritol kinase n=1 Tax=Caulifigura coniformis TaxID=2527983 RepID=A0A517SH58_9PLAN|nr:4-(cytidine 5'-diphospho)-2-C-methyl-D-erythritol kinase [Caulifigura coniformis]QDT55453.1 4-diphosphocytidyl-2-C-methyl-D-erythritol kinase [Caulifigura coniformis]